MRNMMATLLLSQGVPMILAGDERGRTQQGNNNAYCQDNEISWVDWYLDDLGREILMFTHKLLRIRQEHPVLRRRRFFQGRRIHGTDIRDILWINPNGDEMNDEDWNNSFVRCIGMLLNGQAMNEWGEQGRRIYDDALLLLVNAHYEPIQFTLPEGVAGFQWEVLVDTAVTNETALAPMAAGQRYSLQDRSLVLLIQRCNEMVQGELHA
jgi:glycogen operon protein